MKKLAWASAITLSAAAAGAVLMTPASAQPGWGGNYAAMPDGSWRESCRYPSMRGNILTAECLTRNDRWVRTSINARSCRSGRIVNDNGRLVCDGGTGWRGGYRGGGDGGYGRLPGGSWQLTCRAPDMRGSRLAADCRTNNGRWLGTSVDMRNCRSNRAENRDGQLVCE